MRKDEFPIVDKLVKDSINEVLDKIKADIKAEYKCIPVRGYYYEDGWIDALKWVSDDIIDKYRKEQE